MGCAGRSSWSGGRRRCGHAAVATECRLQCARTGPFCRIQRTGLRKDCLDDSRRFNRPGESLLRSETRVVATDSVARRRFRRYWSVYSPGILVIRYLALRLAKASAERLASEPLLEH